MDIPAASAAAFALAASELLGNALKHAYPPGQGGRIAITLSDGDGVCALTIADGVITTLAATLEGAM